MDKATVLKIVRDYDRALRARGVRPCKIVLYGSWARGEPHEGSDIDLVVVSEDFEGKGYWERIEILADALCEIWQPVEAVAMTPAEWESGNSMIAQFAREGEVVSSP